MVTERTQEIAAEKERGDQLLNNLLPADVALELKMGNSTTARSFDCVSIFFRYNMWNIDLLVGYMYICCMAVLFILFLNSQ